MYFGVPILCLEAKDLGASKRFHESLGMQVLEEVPGVRVGLRSGHLGLALMTERYRRGERGSAADGECWFTRDPDGNAILFDTNELERGESFERKRPAEVLETTERESRNPRSER